MEQPSKEALKLYNHRLNIRNSIILFLIFALKDFLIMLSVQFAKNGNFYSNIEWNDIRVINILSIIYPIVMVICYLVTRNYRIWYIASVLVFINCIYDILNEIQPITDVGIFAIYGFMIVMLLGCAYSGKILSRIKVIFPELYAEYKYNLKNEVFKKYKKHKYKNEVVG
ncbi:MAG: hypothetical protein ACI4V7_10255 [Succinivibrionaceae bacterium]